MLQTTDDRRQTDGRTTSLKSSRVIRCAF